MTFKLGRAVNYGRRAPPFFMETIDQKIADEILDNLILNTINTIRKKTKRPDAF